MPGLGLIGVRMAPAVRRHLLGGAFWTAVLGLAPLASVADDFQTPAIPALELHERLEAQDKPLVVDVREPGEFRIGHVPGAVNMPEAELEQHLPEFKGDRAVVLYCIFGKRTKLAEQLLLDHEVPNVFHLQGGLKGWMGAGFPIAKGGG